MARELQNPMDYRTLIDELWQRFVMDETKEDPTGYPVKEQIRLRFANLLGSDPGTPMSDIINQLAAKWRQDGLI